MYSVAWRWRLLPVGFSIKAKQPAPLCWRPHRLRVRARGLEYAVTNNWTVRVEALYVDLGTSTGNATFGCRFGFKNTYTLGRLGLNYKF